MVDARAPPAGEQDTPRDEFYRSSLGRSRGEDDLECSVPELDRLGSRDA